MLDKQICRSCDRWRVRVRLMSGLNPHNKIKWSGGLHHVFDQVWAWEPPKLIMCHSNPYPFGFECDPLTSAPINYAADSPSWCPYSLEHELSTQGN